ncbi:hypothetical protein [Kitasatospora cineracea]|uniref:hypothetical protein n=1 Tax=Kitasatospora cineracea TaxID=88074 RepID=UPI0038268E8F
MLARRRPAPAVPARATACPPALRRWAALTGVALPLLLAAPALAVDPAAGARQQAQAQLDAARQQARAQLDAARQQVAVATAVPVVPAPGGAISGPPVLPVLPGPSVPTGTMLPSATATRTAPAASSAPAVPAAPVEPADPVDPVESAEPSPLPSASPSSSPSPSPSSSPSVSASASGSAAPSPEPSLPASPEASVEPVPSSVPAPVAVGHGRHQQAVVPLLPTSPEPSDDGTGGGDGAVSGLPVPAAALPGADSEAGEVVADPEAAGADGVLAAGPVVPVVPSLHWSDPSVRLLPLGAGLGLIGLGLGLVGLRLRRR